MGARIGIDADSALADGPYRARGCLLRLGRTRLLPRARLANAAAYPRPFAEIRTAKNGRVLQHGAGLIGASKYFGIESIDAIVKESMRSLAMRGGPFTENENRELLDYRASDVALLGKLLHAMWSMIDLPRAVLRGRYMAAVARMESVGVPIDIEMLALIHANWLRIKDGLIAAANTRYGVFDDGSFSQRRFSEWLVRHGIQWR